MDWEDARRKLIETLEHCKYTIGRPGCVMGPYLMGLGNLITRYNTGERSKTLYDEIMELS